MDWDQNEELVEQILRTGMYAKLYDEETTYGYLTYLTYRVEDTLFTWKKKSDVDGFWADLTWEEYISFLRREKTLLLAAQRVLFNTVMAFPASAFDFTLSEAEVDFPVARYDSAGMLHMAKLYSFENCISIVEFLMFRAERAYYRSMAGNLVSFVLFSVGMVGSPLPIWLMREDFLRQITEQGMPADYVNTLAALSSNGMLIVLFLAPVVGAVIGGILARAMFRKHFEKAGLV